MLRAPWSTQAMPAEELAHHVFTTYANVRYGMAFIAFAFPLALFVVGALYGVGLQPSMSAYYWAAGGGTTPPARIWFVGILFIVGAFLYLYKGFTSRENLALNVAGICAFGVALVPMPWNCGDRCAAITLHGVFAVLLFLGIAYVSLWRATDTLALVQDETLKAWYRRRYCALGLFMVASPLTAFLATALLTGGIARYVFFIEAAGIYAFAAYWLLKSRELKRTNADLEAVRGRLRATDEGLRPSA